MAKRLSRRCRLRIRRTRSTAASGRCSPRASVRPAGRSINDFVDPIERISAPYYGVEPDELWRRASASEHIADARVPVLVLHPEDDQHHPGRARADARGGGEGQRPGARLDSSGRRPRRDRRGRPGVVLRRVPRGFFERWAGYGERGPRAATRTRTSPGQADLLRREVSELDNDILRRLLWTGLLAADRAPWRACSHTGPSRDLGAGLQGGPAGVSMSSTAAPAGPPLPTTSRSASSSSTSRNASRP